MTALGPGARLAHFVIQRQLGAGGMGVVYEALDETLGRRVAIKVLPPELVGSAERRQRFLREARSAAQMSHPNIATVFEIDEVDGRVFIVMELVAGESLRDLMTATRVSTSRALDIAVGVARGLAHAHAAGLVHRDLKPENVMVLPNDAVKVLDFGIAKPEAAESSDKAAAATAITEEGRVLGTPGYMAPEQARGESVDARTDIFAIGVVLYEMVTGVRPFQGSSSLDIIVSTTRDEPPPVASHNPGAPRVIESILRRCLAKDRNDRYASADELAGVLEAAAREVSLHELATTQAMPTPFPSVAPPKTLAMPEPAATTTAASALAPAPPPSFRLPWAVGVGLVVLSVFVGIGAVKALRGRERPREPPSAPAAHPEREPRLGLDTLDRYSREVGSVSPGEWETAALDFERATAAVRRPSERWKAARPFCLGMRDLSRGDLDAALAALRSAAAVDPSFALPHVGLSSALVRAGKTDEAVREAQTAQTLGPELVVAIAAAGRAYAAAGRSTDAIEQLQRALAKSPVPGLRAQLALAHHAAGFDDAAEREANQTLKEDPDNVMAHVLLAERALEKRDGNAAHAHTERAVAVEPRNVAAWLAHGDALLLAKRNKEARAALTEAVRLWTETKQLGAPLERLKIVKSALDQGKLPPARAASAAAAAAGRAGPRASPARPSARPPRTNPAQDLDL
ncbi:MAG: protein kinase [Myxococcales bacterium]|nr:protein kinase [Myxococcales bacterium]